MCSMSLTLEVRLRSKFGNDALLHLFRREAVVHPQDADDGNVDVGEDIDGHGDDGGPAQNGDQDSHHDKGIRAA